MIYDATMPCSVTVCFDSTRRESLPIQDEPGGGIDFQHKVGLRDSGNSFMIGTCD